MLQGTSRIKYLRIPPTTHYYPQNPRDYVCQLGLTSLMNNYDNFTSLKGKSNIFFRNNLHYTCTFHHFPNLILLLWFKNEIFQFYKFIEWLFLTFKCCCKGIHTVIRKKDYSVTLYFRFDGSSDRHQIGKTLSPDIHFWEYRLETAHVSEKMVLLYA